jgi:hypothetical protein
VIFQSHLGATLLVGVHNGGMNAATYTLLAAAIASAASWIGFWLTGRQQGRARRADRRVDAYASLLVAAGEVLRAYRRDFYSVSSDFGQLDADRVNAQMAELGSVLHRASAVVALTGSKTGREQGKALYGAARGVADARVVATDDPMCPWGWTPAEGGALDAAIEGYKAALISETAAPAELPPRRLPGSRAARMAIAALVVATVSALAAVAAVVYARRLAETAGKPVKAAQESAAASERPAVASDKAGRAGGSAAAGRDDPAVPVVLGLGC